MKKSLRVNLTLILSALFICTFLISSLNYATSSILTLKTAYKSTNNANYTNDGSVLGSQLEESYNKRTEQDNNITVLYKFVVNFSNLPWELSNYQLRLVFDSRELYNAGYVNNQLSNIRFAIVNETNLSDVPFVFEGKYGAMVNTISPSENTTVWIKLSKVKPNDQFIIALYTSQNANVSSYKPTDIFDFYTNFTHFENFSSYGGSPYILSQAKTSNGKVLKMSGWSEIVNTFPTEWTSPVLVWESRSKLVGSTEAYMPFVGFSTSGRSGDEDNAYQFGYNVYGSTHSDDVRIFKDSRVIVRNVTRNLPRYDWTLTSFKMEKINDSCTLLHQTVSSEDEIVNILTLNDSAYWAGYNPIEMGIIVWYPSSYVIDWIRVHKYSPTYQQVEAYNLVMKQRIIFFTDFSYNDLFEDMYWLRTDNSVYVNIASGNLYISRDNDVDDYAEYYVNVTFPFVLEARSKLIVGGNDYVLPAFMFYNATEDKQLVVTCNAHGGVPHWLFNLEQVAEIGPTSENEWWDVKIVLYETNQSIYAKTPSDNEWKLVAKSNTTLSQITSIVIRQHWDAAIDVDFVKLYSFGYNITSIFDTDKDGMPDWWENQYGLNATDAIDASFDNDSDGLTNLQEYKLGTNPLRNDTDSDGLIDGEEVNQYLTNPLCNDTDADGLLDGFEVVVSFTNATNPDTDEDGLLDGWEVSNGLNATNPDTDGDGMPDGWEITYGLNATDSSDASVDIDGDGLTNLEEYQYSTNATNSDTDSDGMPDGWEVQHELNATNAEDASQDKDSDGLTNLQEYLHNTNITDPDTDDDGMPDGWEVTYNLNPLDSNDANSDPDNDGLTNLQEYQYGTNPRNIDTDGDGLPDNWEIQNQLNPLDADTASQDNDQDNLTNAMEYQHHTDPNNPDTDGDGMPDGWEVANGLNPTVNDASQDADGDGITNYEEYLNGMKANSTNSDGDLLPDNVDFMDGWLDDVTVTISSIVVILIAFTIYQRRKAVAL